MDSKSQKDVFYAGEHCQESTCHKLDFLPVRCDGCRKNFCNDHFRYERHQCSSGRLADNQVPVCPLCNTPIAVKRGELPDVRVGQHIDADCQSETALNQRKVYANRCSMKGCKKKEMMRLECNKCHQSFCLTHRFPDDHNCTPSSVSRAGSAALARIARLANPNPNLPPQKLQSSQTYPPQKSNQMSEDEAFARALQVSLNVGQGDGPSTSATSRQHTLPINPPTSQEEEDLALAQAISASEAEFQAQNTKSQNCVMA